MLFFQASSQVFANLTIFTVEQRKENSYSSHHGLTYMAATLLPYRAMFLPRPKKHGRLSTSRPNPFLVISRIAFQSDPGVFKARPFKKQYLSSRLVISGKISVKLPTVSLSIQPAHSFVDVDIQ